LNVPTIYVTEAGTEINVWIRFKPTVDAEEGVLTLFEKYKLFVEYDTGSPGSQTVRSTYTLADASEQSVETTIDCVADEWQNWNIRLEFGKQIQLSIWQQDDHYYQIERNFQVTHSGLAPFAIEAIAAFTVLDFKLLKTTSNLHYWANLRIFGLQADFSWGRILKFQNNDFP